MSKFKDLTNERFGYLKVIRYVGKNKRGQSLWECLCDCKKVKTIHGFNLSNGHTSSCGCLNSEKLSERNYTHGMSKTKIYATWLHMKQRCYDKNDTGYKNYGGRGIKVCDEWHDFEVFYKDMGDVPENMSIERKDVNGNYCKKNCKWATAIEQANNTRRNHFITYNGESLTISQWARKLNISENTLERRINLLKMETDEAVTMPLRNKKREYQVSLCF